MIELTALFFFEDGFFKNVKNHENFLMYSEKLMNLFNINKEYFVCLFIGQFFFFFLFFNHFVALLLWKTNS